MPGVSQFATGVKPNGGPQEHRINTGESKKRLGICNQAYWLLFYPPFDERSSRVLCAFLLAIGAPMKLGISLFAPAWIALLVVDCLCIQPTLAQLNPSLEKPTPIASTKLGDQTLELHLIDDQAIRPFHGESLKTFPMPELMMKVNKELDITPWKETSLGLDSKKVILGLMLVNSDGTMAESSLKTFTAYRCLDNNGAEARHWHFGDDSPIQEYTDEEIVKDFPLAPLVVELPKGATSIKSLEFFVLHSPGVVGMMEFDRASFNKNSARWDDGILVIPVNNEAVKPGLGFQIGVFSDPMFRSRKKTDPPASLLGQIADNLSVPGMRYQVVLSDGSVRSSNFVGSASFTPKTQSELMTTMRKHVTDARKAGRLKENEMKFLTDGKNTTFDAVAIGFSDLKDFETFQVYYSIPRSGGMISKVVLENIPVVAQGDKEAISKFVQQSRVEARDRRSAGTPPLATATFRTWRDKSGKFNVDAKWIDSTADAIVLEKSDGKRITVPKNKLSDEDLRFLEKR